MLDSTDIVSQELGGETVKVKDIKYLVQDGNSYAYIISDDGIIYKVDCAEFETIVLVEPGDTVKLVSADEEGSVRDVVGFELK